MRRVDELKNDSIQGGHTRRSDEDSSDEISEEITYADDDEAQKDVL